MNATEEFPEVVDVAWRRMNGERSIDVRDAHGNPIAKCIEANRITGRCVCLATDENGVLLLDTTKEPWDTVKEVRMFPAPLQLSWK